MKNRPALISVLDNREETWAPAGHVLAFAIITLTLLGASGCGEGGPPRASVQGTITWEGTPIEDGKISFIPQNGGPEVTAKIIGGKYELPKIEGPVIGTNLIAILGLRNLGPQEAGPPHPPGTMIETTQQFIPTEYNNSSKLTVEIQDGENTHNLVLPKS